MSKTNSNIRGWIILIFSVLIVLVVLPFVIWNGVIDDRNLKERGKEGQAIVLEVKGFKGDKIVFKYEVGGEIIEKRRDAPSNYKVKKGDMLKIIYDSLNVESVKVVWQK